MGKFVAFWSEDNKVGRTMIMYLVLKRIEQLVKDNLKILVVDISQGSKSILKMFEMKKYGLCMEDVINLKINAEFELKTEDLLARTDNMYFLRRRHFFRDIPFGHSEILNDFIDELKTNFDIVLFDTSAGKGDSFTNSIISSCDCLVNVLPGKTEFDNGICDDNAVNIMNFCTVNVINDKQISVLQRQNKGCYIFPYCKQISYISNSESIQDITQYDYLFNKNINSVSRLILEKIDINVDSKTQQAHNKSLLTRLLAQ